jgi:nucleoside-diphosphate-sugar epimerase
MFTRALVLGATGMIGCHAVHAGLRRATRVRALVRPDSDARILAGLDLELARGDLRDRASLAAALEGCDLLIHAAAAYPKRHFGAAAFLASARAGMENLISAAQAAGPELRRIVYVSSVTTIGRPTAKAAGNAPHRGSPADLPLARESDLHVIEDPSPYFRVKAMMEDLAQTAAGGGLPVVIVNPTFCVDEFDDHRSTAQLLVPLAKGMLPAFVPGRLNAVATRDVGEGIWRAA